MNHTKNINAEAFIQLIDEKCISKITVKDIADRCDMNRNTFYYHFQDIPDLCEYICREKIDALIQNHCRPDSPREAVLVISEYFTRHSASLLHIYRSLSREVFLTYLNQLALYLVEEYLDMVCQQTQLPPAKREVLVRYYKCVLVGILLDWLDADMGYDLTEMAVLICDLKSTSGREILEKFSLSN